MSQGEFIIKTLPKLLFGFPAEQPGGLVLSLLLGLLAVGLGFMLALPLGLAGADKRGRLAGLAGLYIRVIRGTPLVLLLLIVHALGSRAVIGLNFAPLTSAIITLVLYAAAYQAEVVQAGLRTIPPAQLQAAQATGLSYPDALRFVILPQALRTMLPAFTDQAISIFKDTSIVLALGVGELMTIGRTVGAASNEHYFLSLYALIGLLYFITAYVISRLARRFEREATSSRLLRLTYQW